MLPVVFSALMVVNHYFFLDQQGYFDTAATLKPLLHLWSLAVEEQFYLAAPIIATVYGEIIAEVPRGWGSVSEFEALICELPEWASGLPLTAGGWVKGKSGATHQLLLR